MKRLITERDVLDAWKKRESRIQVPANGLITPAAENAANVHGIVIEKISVQESQKPVPAPTSADHSKKIIIGSDHGGFELKEQLKQQLQKLGYEVEDVGTFSTESVDYPDFAHVVAQKVAQATDLRGIIVDGAGVGSSIAANKVPGVRAAACQDVYTARNSRAHNNANVLTLGSRVLGPDVATDIVTVWLNTEFEGGRHANRVDKIMDIDRKYRI